jgi:hypothetical protein
MRLASDRIAVCGRHPEARAVGRFACFDQGFGISILLLLGEAVEFSPAHHRAATQILTLYPSPAMRHDGNSVEPGGADDAGGT